MREFFRDRLNIIKLFCVLICVAISGRLIQLQIVKGDEYEKRADSIKTRTIVAEAPRGNIVDRFGRVLAENKLSYAVTIMKSNDISNADLNRVIAATINVIEKNGDKLIDDLPILVDPVRFIYEDEEREWKQSNGVPLDATPMEAFAVLRAANGIPEGATDAGAYKTMTEDLGLDLPFKLGADKFSYDIKIDNWKKANKIPEEMNAEQAMNKLLADFEISAEEYGWPMARKILSVRYLLRQSGKNYMPVEIASDVSEATRAEIKEGSGLFLTGVDISEKSIRYYPGGQFACHVIGYMGKINSEEYKEYQEKGYSANALIGKDGIESSMESKLKGVDGAQILEVDNRGNQQGVMQVKEPIPGDTVFLTIDNKLQEAAEKSLRETMKKVHGGKTSGAVVAMDVNTGAVLAMASEPGFDINMFATGIGYDDWNSLQVKDVHDPAPLRNNAIAMPLAPGSTFKMVTATAALATGKVTPNEHYTCTGVYTGVPNVRVRDASGERHGSINIVEAIEHSCNSFFCEMGRRIGGENFDKYTKMYGFGQKTGIELPGERAGKVQTPEYKKQDYRFYLSNYLKNNCNLTKEQQNTILDFIDQEASYSTVKKTLKEYNITDKDVVAQIWYYVNNSRWMPGDNLNAAIGQGLDSATALQVACYISSIANGGTRYKPYIVKKTVGSDGKVEETKPKVAEKIDVDPSVLKTIREGMFDVINRNGTGTSFRNGTEGILAAGKTGTAQNGKNIPDHSWFVAFAPYDKPQIAVVAVIYQGGFGTQCIPIAREVIKTYLTPDKISDDVITVDDITP